jgi:RHS repeat-associated protein
LPHRYNDPFGNTTIVTFDSQNFLLIIKVEDPIGNVVTVGGIDYRLLQPFLVMDPNQNRSMVAFDVLGMVVGTAVMGKPEPATPEGDNLDDFDSNLTTKVIRDHITDPLNTPHSILKDATTRMVYDLFSYYRTKAQPDPEPPVVYTMVRETHFHNSDTGNQNTKIQHIFSYSDGFGREIQKKIQAERGPLDLDNTSSPIVDPRWVGSGWTIFNNKGKPVRQYEPFFSDTHNFEFKRLKGVSSIVFYDPMGRTVAILHPNHTYEKVVFDNWKQITYDVNDTVLLDPRTDSDISNIVSKYFESLSDPNAWKTWYQERLTGTNISAEELSAARKTEFHANTPTTTFFDSLGRSFITFGHNGFEQDGTRKQFLTRSELDIEGNIRKVRDEIKQNGDSMVRVVMIYDYDMVGNVIHQASMDASERWMLNDILGNSIRGWDSRRHTFITEYDTLRRPIRSYVITIESANPNQVSSTLVARIVYGERHPQDILLNLRGKIYLQLDKAGVLRNETCDFKGNILSSKRQLTRQYKETLSWKDVDSIIPVDNTTKLNIASLEAALASMPQDDQLEETFTSSTKYDALNRPVLIETPHSNTMLPNIIKPFYNKANMLEKLDVNLRSEQQNGQQVWTQFVINIDYDAKGRRTLIEYGSGFIDNSQHGVVTTYEYDKLTSRLNKMLTRRNLVIFPDDCLSLPDSSRSGCDIQNLCYTYDPAGNITKISDEAQQSIFFHGHWVDPSCEYTYDPLYRLVEATGREHLGQPRSPPVAHSHNDVSRVGLESPNDGNLMGNYIELMGNYIERYSYDNAGNIEFMKHYSIDNLSEPAWSRTYNYNEQSLILEELSSVHNNQLSRTTTSGNNTVVENYFHDSHGNIIRMPHLADHPNPKDANMHSNYKDQLQQIQMRGGGTAYYVYDSGGQLMRKVVEKSPGLVEERIYLGIIEIFRRRNGSGSITLERETLHVMDDKHRIALVETRTQGQETDVPEQLIRYQFGNHLGSTNLELDSEAQIISYEEYTPYGSTSFQSGRILAEVKLKRYRYTDMERDEESGFYYHGARYYASWLCRWTSCDPIGIDGGLNLYCYCFCNPVNLNDPNGRQVAPTVFEPYNVNPVPITNLTYDSPERFGRSHDELESLTYYLQMDQEINRAWGEDRGIVEGGAFTVFENQILAARKGSGEGWSGDDSTYINVGLGDTFYDVTNILSSGELVGLIPIKYLDQKGVSQPGWLQMISGSNGGYDALFNREGDLISARGNHNGWNTTPGFVASLLNPIDLLVGGWATKLVSRGARAAAAGVEALEAEQAGARAMQRVTGSVTHGRAPRWLQTSLPTGGRLHVSTVEVTGSEVEQLVLSTAQQGRSTTVLSGTHGDDIWGRMESEGSFLLEDITSIAKRGHAPGVQVLDVTRMSENQLQTVLLSGNDVYAAWCWSCLSRSLGRAFDKVIAKQIKP